MNRDAEEIRLNYCKKCGSSLDEHDDIYCEQTKYPALKKEFDYLLTIADLYSIDLTVANENCADDGRHGSVEGHINLDICGAIHTYNTRRDEYCGTDAKNIEAWNKNGSLKDFVTEELTNWAYDHNEVAEAFANIKELDI